MLLTPDEKIIAEQTPPNGPVTFLGVGLDAFVKCIQNHRRARTIEEAAERLDIFNRFRIRVFDGRDENGFRDRYLSSTRTRLILLGADRGQAERLATEAVRHIGEWHSRPLPVAPRLLNILDWPPPNVEEAEQRWDADEQWLADACRIEGELAPYANLELQAYPGDFQYIPYPLGNTSGLSWDRTYWPQPATSSDVIELTPQTVDAATQHVLRVLSSAVGIVDIVIDERKDKIHLSMSKRLLFSFCEQLRNDGMQNCGMTLLQDHFNGRSQNTYKIAGVIQPSVHDAILVFSRGVLVAFECAVRACLPDSTDWDRRFAGPWEPHEMYRAIPIFRQSGEAMISALDGLGRQKLEADLKQESAGLKLALWPPRLDNTGRTLPTAGTPDASSMGSPSPTSDTPNLRSGTGVVSEQSPTAGIVGPIRAEAARDAVPPNQETNFPFLKRVPHSVEELREWLAEADTELTDISLTWADFAPFVYDDDADWIALCAYRYALALLPIDITREWKLPETTKDHRIFDAIRYVRIYLATCPRPVAPKGKQSQKPGPGTGGKKPAERKPGRPVRTEDDPGVREENQLYRDWLASGSSQAEFLRARGRDLAEGKLILDRAKKRVEKPQN